ncbi:MAG: c-type cytochrome domain-containing protein, partial [Pirellulales bacterium]
MVRRIAGGLVALLWVAIARGADVDFERQIVPILVRHCAACHNSSDPAGGLDLLSADTALAGGESGSPAIVPGDAQQSNLLERIRAHEMPPEGKADPVSDEDVSRLEKWIQAGAHWPAGRVLTSLEFTTDARAG